MKNFWNNNFFIKSMCLIYFMFCIYSLSAVNTKQQSKMNWWLESKFGVFVHFGPYSLLGGEYKNIKTGGEHIMLHAKIPLKEYSKIASSMYPKNFDAMDFVKLVKQSGAKYIVFTSKHHDGFAMYHSKASKYNIYDHTNFKRDPIKELKNACKKYGIKLGIYYSLGRDWQDPDVPTNWPTKGGRSNTWDYPDEDSKVFLKYYTRKAKPQVKEIMENYNPDIMWFDTPELISDSLSNDLRETILKINPRCIINDRIGNGKGDYATKEQKLTETILNKPWEACLTMSKHWGYVTRDTITKSSEMQINLLVDIVSKGGNLLLNVGPKPDGSLRESQKNHIVEIGKWMNYNSQAIYNTKPWKIYGENNPELNYKNANKFGNNKDLVNDETPSKIENDLRFTTKNDNTMYVFARSWKLPKVYVNSLSNSDYKITNISLLGYKGSLNWEQDNKGLIIDLPLTREIPVYVFKVHLKNIIKQ